MSYDLYCYRPSSDVPNAAEAELAIEAINAAEESGATVESSPEVRESIVAALLTHNPRLERFAFNFDKIAESEGISEEEARRRYDHVELNAPQGDLAIQFTVYGDHVNITMPYWYKDERADQLFSELSGYLKVIRRTAGFFVHDPQTGAAFDPERSNLTDQKMYENIVRDMPKIALNALSSKKPWWKFW